MLGLLKRKKPIAILEKNKGFELVGGKPTFLLKNGHGLKHNVGDIVNIKDGDNTYRYEIIDSVVEKKVLVRLHLKHKIW